MGLNGWVVGMGVAPQAGTTHLTPAYAKATAGEEGWFNGMV